MIILDTRSHFSYWLRNAMSSYHEDDPVRDVANNLRSPDVPIVFMIGGVAMADDVLLQRRRRRALAAERDRTIQSHGDIPAFTEDPA